MTLTHDPTNLVHPLVSGLLALLEEDSPRLKVHALQKLHELVDQFWAEVAAAVPLIEELSEDEAFEVSGSVGHVAEDALGLGCVLKNGSTCSRPSH